MKIFATLAVTLAAAAVGIVSGTQVKLERNTIKEALRSRSHLKTMSRAQLESLLEAQQHKIMSLLGNAAKMDGYTVNPNDRICICKAGDSTDDVIPRTAADEYGGYKTCKNEVFGQGRKGYFMVPKHNSFPQVTLLKKEVTIGKTWSGGKPTYLPTSNSSFMNTKVDSNDTTIKCPRCVAEAGSGNASLCGYTDSYGCDSNDPFENDTMWIKERNPDVGKCSVWVGKDNYIMQNAIARLEEMLTEVYKGTSETAPTHPDLNDGLRLRFVTFTEEAFNANERLRPFIQLVLDDQFANYLMPSEDGVADKYRHLSGRHNMVIGCPNQEGACGARENSIWRYNKRTCMPGAEGGKNIPQDVYEILSETYAALCGNRGDYLGDGRGCLNVVCKETGFGHKGSSYAAKPEFMYSSASSLFFRK